MIANKIKLGMPHLNYNGLDEVWLLKESGHIHWNMLHDVIDSWYAEDTRFYASFFQAKINFDNSSQLSFKEDDELSISSNIASFNRKIYRSTTRFTNGESTGTVTLDSIFVTRDNNNNLNKFEPSREVSIEQVEDINLNQYQNYKKILSPVGGNQLQFSPTNLFNGVKLLYCANYLYLSQQSEYIEKEKPLSPIKYAELFYFNNINISDKIYGKTTISDSNTTVLHNSEKLLSYSRIIR